MYLNVTKELFNSGKNISIIGSAAQKFTTSKPIKNPEFYAKEIREKYAVKDSATATLNTAAFLVKALVKSELSLAVTPKDWTQQLVYGEFKHLNQDKSVSRYKFTCSLTPKIIVSYEENAPEEGNPYAMLPYFIARTFFSDDAETYTYLGLAVEHAKKDGSSLAAIQSVFRYCDSFYWNTKYVWPESEVEVNENSLSLATVKEARKMGHLLDVSIEEEYEFLPNALKSYLIHEGCFDFSPCEELAGIPVRGKGKIKKKKKEEDGAAKWKKILKDIKAGKYLISYEWSEDQKKHIPSMSYLDTFIPTEEFYEILRKIQYRLGEHMVEAAMFGLATPDDIKNDIVNILLYGDPGSGKTALVHAIGAATGMPVYSVKFNEDSEDDVFEGKNKIVEGKISFVGTDFLEGFEKGGLILMEEINLGRANMLTSVMNQALEYPFYVEKNGYEKITRHPLVAAFATMNLDTDGTMTLNSAMAQRFNNKYMIGEPSANDFKARLISNGYPEDRVNYVYSVYDKIRTFLKETAQKQKYLKELSIRQCIAALNDMEEGAEAKRAVFNTMYGAICIKNRKLADQIKEGILNTAPDYTGK